MKGYVYMIDYRDSHGADQCECQDKAEMLTQLKYLLQDKAYIVRVKLVKDDDRWVETEISKSLQREVDKLITKYGMVDEDYYDFWGRAKNEQN